MLLFPPKHTGEPRFSASTYVLSISVPARPCLSFCAFNRRTCLCRNKGTKCSLQSRSAPDTARLLFSLCLCMNRQVLEELGSELALTRQELRSIKKASPSAASASSSDAQATPPKTAIVSYDRIWQAEDEKHLGAAYSPAVSGGRQTARSGSSASPPMARASGEERSHIGRRVSVSFLHGFLSLSCFRGTC